MSSAACGRIVLIVEDDGDTRAALKEVLEDGAYRPLTAPNGKAALEQLRAAPIAPCVILLDVMMPEMDGREFRQEQQKDPALRGIPVVVLSAHADGVSAARQMQAVGFLNKPVDLGDLLRVIERYCSRD